MTACMQNATILVDALYVDTQLFFKDVNLLVKGQFLPAENPGTAKGGTTNHHGIDAKSVKRSVRIIQRLDVAITNNGNMDVGILLHFANQSPVCLARVHLTTGAPMNGQGLDATLLQLFCQCGDNELLVVPAQTR